MRSARVPALVVEFIGLPGAGKSALAHETARVLRTRGLTVREPTYVLAHRRSESARRVLKTWDALATSFRSPSQSYRWLRAFADSQQARWHGLVKITLNWLHITAVVRRAERASGVVLLDQGLLQALWSVEYEAGVSVLDGADLSERVANCLAERAVLVVTEARLETIARRLTHRPGAASRLEQASSQSHAARSLARAREVLARVETLAAAVAARRGTPIIRVANDDDGDLAAKASGLANRIAALLDGGAVDAAAIATTQPERPGTQS